MCARVSVCVCVRAKGLPGGNASLTISSLGLASVGVGPVALRTCLGDESEVSVGGGLAVCRRLQCSKGLYLRVEEAPRITATCEVRSLSH